MEIKTNIEKIEFVTSELKKISQELEESGGEIAEVSDLNLSNGPITTVKITLTWADRNIYPQRG